MSETPTTTDRLAAAASGWLSLPAGPDAHLTVCAGAVVGLLARLDHVTPDTTGAYPDDVWLGATMLTARLYRRRNSPAGIESVGELGASYVSRYDSDIARLLRIDAFAAPRVG